ncbi:hypothetical protein HGRIS_004158 [Hohenbuehelia grisea]|uniref:Uncharacterized protein n=1 Tax=Hohenbuehelia grisea TaxID=104357 RepID=A0ABR3JIW4_9AGAR
MTIVTNNLSPPSNVDFFKFFDLLMLDQRVQVNDSVYYDITWRVDQYAYAVNGNPFDNNFVDNNGRIYVVLVHSGSVRMGGSIDGLKLKFTVSGQGSTSGNDRIAPYIQLPLSNSAVTSGEYNNYEIDYSEKMQVLKNQASEYETFDAAYHETFARHFLKSSGWVGASDTGFEIVDEYNAKGVRLLLCPDRPTLLASLLTWCNIKSFDALSTHEIHGLSIFRSRTLSAWPCKFDFTHAPSLLLFSNNNIELPIGTPITKTVTIDPDFKRP